MGNDKYNDDFINFLVDETLKEAKSPDRLQRDGKLSNYFEKKRIGKRLSKGLIHSVEIFCDKHGIPMAHGQYQNDSHCYRFNIQEMTLDIPSNWYHFNRINEPEKIGSFFSFSAHEDDAKILEVFSTVYSQRFNFIYCFKEKKEFVLIFLNRFHYDLHKNFFEDISDHKSVSEQIKKAG